MSGIMEKIYGEENRFSKKKFLFPSVNYTPIYTWVWNGPISHREIDKQLDEMVRLGMRALDVVPEPKGFRPTSLATMMEPDYLTPAYFEEYQYMVEEAKKRGMLFCLYDEGGWPSGGACGKVMLKHPEFARHQLASRKVEVEKGVAYTMSEDAYSAFDENWNLVKNGDVFDCDAIVTEYYARLTLFEEPGYPDFPDLMIKEATEAFIEMTHEEYKKYIGQYFGDTVRMVFSDEASHEGFCHEMAEIFEKENGYSIAPFFPELLGDRPVTEAGAKARVAWFDMCGRLLCERFLLPQKEWCNKHNLAFMGHYNCDHQARRCATDSGTYHFMKALRCMDMPGIDVIWRQIYPNKEKAALKEKVEDINTIFPRCASSAASQSGSRYAFTESLSVYGAALDFDLMRYVLNYQAVRGVNMFNLTGISAGKEAFLMGPSFTEEQGCFRDFAVFNRYAERLSYLASLGERVADTALYMPICDFHAGVDVENVAAGYEQIGQELERCRVLFDIADDEVFDHVEDGKVKMGKAEYYRIVVPPCKFMPEKTKAQLKKLMEQGGEVYTTRPIAGLEDATVIEEMRRVFSSPLEISGDADMIRLGIRQAENGKLLMLYNQAETEKTISVSLEEATYLVDGESGKITLLCNGANRVNMTIPYGKIIFLWQGEAPECDEETEYTEQLVLDQFTFRRTDRFVVGYMNYEKEEYTEEDKPITLGDWADVVGVDYTGSGIYRTTFKAPKREGKISIDMGEVHASCEVFVNGTSMGVYGFTPFCCELDAENLKDENVLEIRVTNTAANEFLHTESFKKWQSWQIGPYLRAANVFHGDFLAGGLYGPVVLKY